MIVRDGVREDVRDTAAAGGAAAGRSWCGAWAGVCVLVVVGVLGLCSVAWGGVVPGPGWELMGNVFPSWLAPYSGVGGRGTIDVAVYNVGEVASSGVVTVTDRLPVGLLAREAGDQRGNLGGGIQPRIGGQYWECTGNGPAPAPGVSGASVVTCTSTPALMATGIAGGGGNPTREVGTNPEPEIGILVETQPGAAESLVNRVTIAGGGAPVPVSTSNVVTVRAGQPGFGLAGWDGWASNADGSLDTQAGSHPYLLTLNTTFAVDEFEEGGEPAIEPAGGELRDVEVRLPPGMVVNPTAVPECSRDDLLAETCPNASQVGVITIRPVGGFSAMLFFRVYNVVPPAGLPGEVAFNFDGTNVFFNGGVRSGSDYGITTRAEHVPQREVASSIVTLWGVPSDPSHNVWRTVAISGRGCTAGELETSCSIGPHPQLKPFITLPTQCGAPLAFQVRANSWGDETYTPWDAFQYHDANGTPAGMTGCETLGFAPTFTTGVDTSKSDTPAGLSVEVTPTTGGLEEPEGLSTSDVQETKVTLPEGLVINPGQAAGLQACQPGQDGLTTPQEEQEGKEDNGPPSCPGASKVGTVKAKTPLLEGSFEKELEGNIYVMQSNPPDLRLLMAFSADSVNVKLVLHVHLNTSTGRLETTVPNIPELPASDFKLSFSGGAQAALDTPTQCGTYTTTGDFTPWSSPALADVFTNAQFSITEGPDGQPCPNGPLPFKPTLAAGSTTDQAGGFTHFSLLLTNGDGQQRLNSVRFTLPKGLSGMLSTVPLCPEPQADQGTCPQASEIGHAVVASGPGPYPLVIPQPGQEPARIYLTGPHNGAPFGVSIVTHVIAGPFNLGVNVVRGAIDVNRRTAQVTLTTDTEGPYAIPQILDGVPTDLRTIDTVIDRPGFMFNPTNCDPQTFAGTATSSQSTTVAIQSRFQVGSCQSLKFKPDFKVSTSGKTSKKNGASLTAKILYPPTPSAYNLATAYAGVQSVKVDLPKQLPSRLSTLQKACVAAVFEANPAGCPPGSIVGHARIITPELPTPRTGPAYFVSHGGEAFPNLTIVLQGDGVTIELIGNTFIKHGITSNTFKSTPDAPFSLFELTLPQGPGSALAANGNLCKTKLTMPTIFNAQNNQTIKQNTNITVTGCTKTHKHNKTKTKKKK